MVELRDTVPGMLPAGEVETCLHAFEDSVVETLDTPVALIVFNRPRLTQAMFARVAAASVTATTTGGP